MTVPRIIGLTVAVVLTLAVLNWFVGTLRCTMPANTMSELLWHLGNCPLVAPADNRPSSLLPHSQGGGASTSILRAAPVNACDRCVRSGAADCHAQCRIGWP
jgi:hypothetical protein